MRVINELLEKYKEDPESLYVDQCRALLDYFEYIVQCKEKEHEYDVKMIDEVKGKAVELYKEIDKLKKENEGLRALEETHAHNEQLLMERLRATEREMTDFSDCWLHKDKLRELFKEVEISDYNSCVEFVLAIKHLLKWEE